MKRIAIFLMSVFALASCAKDDLGNVAPNATGTTTVTFSADGFDEVSTRAVNETSINDVTILQFVSGTLTKKIDLSGVTFGSAVEVEDLESMPATTMETVTINGTEVERMKENTQENVIIFLANTTVSSSDLSLTENTTTFSAFKEMTMGTLDLSTYLPMVGYYYDGIVAGATNQMAVSLKRSVAKISFTLNTSNFYDGTEQPTIDVKSITLKNVPNEITPYACQNRPALPVSPDNGVWPSAQSPFPTYSSGTFKNYETTDNQSTNPTASGTFYMPENCRGSYDNISKNSEKTPKNTSENDDNSLTYIEVVLEYTVNSTGVVNKATYQIYLGGNSTGDMNLLRNTNYSVTTYLYGADETDTRISVESLWDPTSVVFPAGTSIEAVANCYMIKPANIPASFNISLLQARSGWSMIDSYTGNTAGENLAAFDALIQSGEWEIVTLWRTWDGTTTDYNITGSKLNLSSSNSGNEVANYYASLTFGSEINNATNGLNSKGGNAVIALKSKQHESTGADINGKAIGTIYWSWHLWFTDYDPDTVSGTTSFASTTAVTAGRIEQYGTSYLSLNSGKYMMDRNLGATVTGLTSNWSAPTAHTSYESGYDGMFYQFGRKDPFVGSNRSSYNTTDQITIYGTDGGAATIDVTDCSTPAVSTDGNLIEAVNNPLHFITVSTGDWAILGNIDYWSYAGAKSPFDPSPAGWRLPASGTWADFNYTDGSATLSFTTQVGGVYDGRVFYPASGYRNDTSGAMNNVGSYGYNWSATPSSSTYGYHLLFSSSSVYPAYSGSRSNGRPVRPIQE